MKLSFVTLLLVVVLFIAVPVMAEDLERYQASRQNNARTIILDTKEGHVWCVDSPAERASILYVGQVRPAKSGEWIVDLAKTPKPELLVEPLKPGQK